MDSTDELLSQWRTAAALLAKWQERARINQLQHYEAAQYYTRAHNALGIPAVVLSTVVGTTVFATLAKQVDLRIEIAVGCISVIAAILAALETFLRYSERAEKHRATAAAYASIRHRLEAATNIPVSLRQPLKEFLTGIEGQIDLLAQSSPNVPPRVWRRIQPLKTALPLSGQIELASATLTAAASAGGAGASQPQDPYRP